MRAGAAGFLLKDGDADELARAIRAAVGGDSLMALSALSNDEIAAVLHLSVATIKTHVGSVLTKLAVRDRTQAVVVAYDAGIRPGRSDNLRT